jgi:hypothetical protein
VTSSELEDFYAEVRAIEEQFSNINYTENKLAIVQPVANSQ